MIKAVIDTNVIVSAYITKNLEAATSKVWEAVLQCKLTPIYNDEILDEYSEVLHREKFGIPERLIKWALDKIVTNGVRGERILSGESFHNPKAGYAPCKLLVRTIQRLSMLRASDFS